MAPLQRKWKRVRGSWSFNGFLASTSEETATCIESTRDGLLAGRVGLIPAGMNDYCLFACDLVIRVLISGDDLILSVAIVEDV